MRLLTHNALRNNAADASSAGGSNNTNNNNKQQVCPGYPLRITATEVRVDESPPSAAEEAEEAATQREIAFVKGILPTLDWPALVQGASDVGLQTIPPTLTEDLAKDPSFLKALYHVLMNVHLVRGILTCPTTGRQFPVKDGIVEFMLDEDECENPRDR